MGLRPESLHCWVPRALHPLGQPLFLFPSRLDRKSGRAALMSLLDELRFCQQCRRSPQDPTPGESASEYAHVGAGRCNSREDKWREAPEVAHESGGRVGLLRPCHMTPQPPQDWSGKTTPTLGTVLPLLDAQGGTARVVWGQCLPAPSFPGCPLPGTEQACLSLLLSAAAFLTKHALQISLSPSQAGPHL